MVQCTFLLYGRVLGTFHVTEDYLTIGAPFKYDKEGNGRAPYGTSQLYVGMIETFTPHLEEDKFCVVSLTSRPPDNSAKPSVEDIGQMFLGSL